jgi:hypothetical protein
MSTRLPVYALQKLLDAVQAASEVTAKLSSGETEGLEELCARFLDDIQASQASRALVQVKPLVQVSSILCMLLAFEGWLGGFGCLAAHPCVKPGTRKTRNDDGRKPEQIISCIPVDNQP